jgi:hypothetical protein
MKKMFLATCLLAASVFALPKVEDVKAAAADGKATVEAKAATAKAKTQTAKKKVTATKEKAQAVQSKAAAEEAKAAASATAVVNDAKAQAADVKAQAADAKVHAASAQAKAVDAKAQAEAQAADLQAKAAEQKAQAEAQAANAQAQAAEKKAEMEAKAAGINTQANDLKAQATDAKAQAVNAFTPVTTTQAPAPEAKQAPTVIPAVTPAPVVAPTPVAEPAPAVAVPAVTTTEEVATVEPASTTTRKKKKMIENAVFSVNQIDFDINADFELEAGKVFWTSEEDYASDNFETWNGEANLAILAETQNFKGKIALAFYPGDLKTDNVKGETGSAEDYFSLKEAWANQTNGWFSFKVGRWDNTDKNGDYFGGYIDGYMNGFLSEQDPENQFEFGFAPNENIDFELALISKAAHLNKGDLRAVFNFHDLPSLEEFEVQLGYRSNIFDKVYDADAIVKHNISLKVRWPIVPDFFTVFGEVALMDMSNDLVVPLTGGMEFNFKTVDRVILEAEYVGDRKKNGYYEGNPKHVKDVLGALYLEKALTDRFSLSAGFHNYGASRDFMLSGNLIGRIN